MTQELSLKFYKPIDQNDITRVERLVSQIFSKKNGEFRLYWEEIKSLFLSAMNNAKLNLFKRNLFWFYVNRVISKGLNEKKSLIEIEGTLRKFIRKRSNVEIDKKGISLERAQRNFKNIKKYITGESILDLGAGDGLLAQQICEQHLKEVFLVDIIDYNLSELPLILYSPEEKIPLEDNGVDTTILYTVLHHSSDPENLLKEAARITKKRLIIKEAYIENDVIQITNSFFDWFYNRVVGDEDINVPLNFLKLGAWEKLLNSYGFQVIETEYVGIDEPIIPEFHVFIIAEKFIS